MLSRGSSLASVAICLTSLPIATGYYTFNATEFAFATTDFTNVFAPKLARQEASPKSGLLCVKMDFGDTLLSDAHGCLAHDNAL